MRVCLGTHPELPLSRDKWSDVLGFAWLLGRADIWQFLGERHDKLPCMGAAHLRCDGCGRRPPGSALQLAEHSAHALALAPHRRARQAPLPRGGLRRRIRSGRLLRRAALDQHLLRAVGRLLPGALVDHLRAARAGRRRVGRGGALRSAGRGLDQGPAARPRLPGRGPALRPRRHVLRPGLLDLRPGRAERPLRARPALGSRAGPALGADLARRSGLDCGAAGLLRAHRGCSFACRHGADHHFPCRDPC
mmetsp:Transcript_93058/g.272337  ORF Transcript_93058/g.272337 Transcript_93058/m.272337 type:complete len:249 (+) Transcript_93058:280-1026(+)